MTQWTTHAQFDSDPRRNGKLRVLRHETAEGESHVIASNVKPDIAPLIAAAPDLLAALQAIRQFVEDEVENRGQAGSYMTDYQDEAVQALEQIDTAIAKAKGA